TSAAASDTLARPERAPGRRVPSCRRRRNDFSANAQLDERAQPLELRGEDAAAERCQAIVASPLVVVGERRATFGLVDQSVGFEATDGAIQVSRLELDRAVGVLDDVLANAVAVAVAGREHGEYEQLDGLQWELRGKRGVCGHVGWETDIVISTICIRHRNGQNGWRRSGKL